MPLDLLALPSEFALCIRQSLRLNQQAAALIAAAAAAEAHDNGISCAFRLGPAREQRIARRQEIEIIETPAA